MSTSTFRSYTCLIVLLIFLGVSEARTFSVVDLVHTGSDPTADTYWKGVLAGLGGSAPITLPSGNILDIITPDSSVTDADTAITDATGDATTGSDVLAAVGPIGDTQVDKVRTSTPVQNTNIVCFGPVAFTDAEQVYSESLYYTMQQPIAEVLAFSSYVKAVKKANNFGVVYLQNNGGNALSQLQQIWGSDLKTVELTSGQDASSSLTSLKSNTKGNVLLLGYDSTNTDMQNAYKTLLNAADENGGELMVPYALQSTLLPLYVQKNSFKNQSLFSNGLPVMADTWYNFTQKAAQAMKNNGFTPTAEEEPVALQGYLAGRVLYEAATRYVYDDTDRASFQTQLFSQNRYLITDVVMGMYADTCDAGMTAQHLQCGCNHGDHIVTLSHYNATGFDPCQDYAFNITQCTPQASANDPYGGMYAMDYNKYVYNNGNNNSDDKSSLLWLWILLAVLGFLLLLLLLILLIWCCCCPCCGCCAAGMLKEEREKGMLSVVVISVDSADQLRQRAPKEMSKATEQLESTLKKHAKSSYCTLVRQSQNKDYYMYGCTNTNRALTFAKDIQSEMMKSKNDFPEIRKAYGGTTRETSMWKGLRLRMGMHTAYTPDLKADENDELEITPNDPVARVADDVHAITPAGKGNVYFTNRSKDDLTDSELKKFKYNTVGARKLPNSDLASNDIFKLDFSSHETDVAEDDTTDTASNASDDKRNSPQNNQSEEKKTRGAIAAADKDDEDDNNQRQRRSDRPGTNSSSRNTSRGATAAGGGAAAAAATRNGREEGYDEYEDDRERKSHRSRNGQDDNEEDRVRSAHSRDRQREDSGSYYYNNNKSNRSRRGDEEETERGVNNNNNNNNNRDSNGGGSSRRRRRRDGGKDKNPLDAKEDYEEDDYEDDDMYRDGVNPPPEKPVNGRDILSVYVAPLPEKTKTERLEEACKKFDEPLPERGALTTDEYNDLLMTTLLNRMHKEMPEGYIEEPESVPERRAALVAQRQRPLTAYEPRELYGGAPEENRGAAGVPRDRVRGEDPKRLEEEEEEEEVAKKRLQRMTAYERGLPASEAGQQQKQAGQRQKQAHTFEPITSYEEEPATVKRTVEAVESGVGEDKNAGVITAYEECPKGSKFTEETKDPALHAVSANASVHDDEAGRA